MIGLGRMGANMVRRLQKDGHECVVYDVSADAVAGLVNEGFEGAASLDELVAAMPAPRHLWIMVPAAFVSSTVAKLAPLLDAGDTIIDGGNSWYRDDVDASGPLAEQGMYLVTFASAAVWAYRSTARSRIPITVPAS